jgi:hypothetical protein
MDSDYCEWHNATLERIADALERIADFLETDKAEKKRDAELKEAMEERIANAEFRRAHERREW